MYITDDYEKQSKFLLAELKNEYFTNSLLF